MMNEWTFWEKVRKIQESVYWGDKGQNIDGDLWPQHNKTFTFNISAEREFNKLSDDILFIFYKCS